MFVQRPGWGLPFVAQVALLACVGGLAFVVCAFGGDSEECGSKQELEQETTRGTHNKRQPTNAGQQRYTSHKRHVYMHLTRTPLT